MAADGTFFNRHESANQSARAVHFNSAFYKVVERAAVYPSRQLADDPVSMASTFHAIADSATVLPERRPPRADGRAAHVSHFAAAIDK